MKMSYGKFLGLILIVIAMLLFAGFAYTEILEKQITETFTEDAGTTNTEAWTGYGTLKSISAQIPVSDEDVLISMVDDFTSAKLFTFTMDKDATITSGLYDQFETEIPFQGAYTINTYCNKGSAAPASATVKIKIVYEK